MVWSGNPEQESVTKIGAGSEPGLIGVIVAVTEPDWPCLSERVAGATDTEKSGEAAAIACMLEIGDAEAR